MDYATSDFNNPKDKRTFQKVIIFAIIMYILLVLSTSCDTEHRIHKNYKQRKENRHVPKHNYSQTPYRKCQLPNIQLNHQIPISFETKMGC